MNAPPDPTDRDAVLVRETEERPVVRDSEDNPVVRFRDLENVKSKLAADLESAKSGLETKIKVGFAVVGAIGVANLLGIRTADHDLGSTAASAARSLRELFALVVGI